MNTQSPGEKLKLCGLLMMSPVTLEGSTIPEVTTLLPLLSVNMEESLYSRPQENTITGVMIQCQGVLAWSANMEK